MPVPPEDPAVETYVALLKHVRLVSQDQLTRALDAFYSNPAETAAADAARDARRKLMQLQSRDPVAAGALYPQVHTEATVRAARFAQKLIDLKFLTVWQQKQLAQGSNKGFFLGPYKLLGPIGKGGMSKLYLAEMAHPPEHDAHSLPPRGERVALKVFPKNLLGNRSFLDRFYREGRMMAEFDHPHIVRGFGLGHAGQTHYYAMEFVRGQDLGKLVERTGPLDYIEAAEYLRQAAAGLEYLHRRGIVHRDVKPGNLVLDGEGVLKVLDFGLALSRREQADHSLTLEHGERLLGTSDYMAPEQARDCHGVDFRADLYSLGCVLYFLVAGQAPFAEGSLAQRIMSHQTAEVPPLKKRRVDCPPAFEDLCARLLAKEPAERGASAQAVHDELANWLADLNARQVRGAATAARQRLARQTPTDSQLTTATSVPESNDVASLILDSGTVTEQASSETVSVPKRPAAPVKRPAPKPSVSDSSLLDALPNGLPSDRFAPTAMIVAQGEPVGPAEPAVQNSVTPPRLLTNVTVDAEEDSAELMRTVADLGGPAPAVKPASPGRPKYVVPPQVDAPPALPAATDKPGKLPVRPGSSINSADYAAEFLQKREIARRIKREKR